MRIFKKILALCTMCTIIFSLSSCLGETQIITDKVLTTTHTVSLVDDYGYTKKINVEDGECLKISSNPSVNNYIFTGWYTDKSRSMLYDFTRPVKNDFTLYAGYTLSYTKKSFEGFRINGIQM